MRTSGTYPEASEVGADPDIAAHGGRRSIRKGRRSKGRKGPGGTRGGSKYELVCHGASPTCEGAATVCAVAYGGNIGSPLGDSEDDDSGAGEEGGETSHYGAFAADWIRLGLRLSGKGDDDESQSDDDGGQVDYAPME